MLPRSETETRRSVLKTVGGALGIASLAGSASAGATTDQFSTGQCAYADGPNGVALVFSQCDGTEDDLVGRVANYEKGTVDKRCKTADGTEWAYVIWNSASPDGWVPATHLTACVTPH